jgi:hypothetical protein
MPSFAFIRVQAGAETANVAKLRLIVKEKSAVTHPVRRFRSLDLAFMNLYFGVLGARVAELADAPDLGSGIREDVGVRVPPFARLFFGGCFGYKCRK